MRSQIYDYGERLKRYRRIIASLNNGGVALRFLDHLASLGLSEGRISNTFQHYCA
ncbi:MAG: hypothetical protein QXZ02_02015 [Candidatus Bathyarchaeia archaeon]